MSVFSETIGNKGLFRGKVGQSHGLPPVFPLYQDENGGAAVCERTRSSHNKVPSGDAPPEGRRPQVKRKRPDIMLRRKSGSVPPVGVVRETKSKTLPSCMP